MALMEIDGQYFDPSCIKSILTPKDQKSRSSGMFEFQQEVVITLEGGREIKTTLLIEEVIHRSKKAAETVSAGPVGGAVDIEQLAVIGNDICKNLEKLVEHTHTISEALIRMSLTPQ